jgi:hypothetical protein
MLQIKPSQLNKQRLKKKNKSIKELVNSGKQLNPFTIHERQYIQVEEFRTLKWQEIGVEIELYK